MNTCLEFDLPVRGDTNASPAFYVNRLASVQNASAGLPTGAIAPAMRKGGCILIPSDVSMAIAEYPAWQVLRTVLLGATAASVLLVNGDAKVDARAHIVRQWIPEEAGQRANVDLRLQRLFAIKAAFGISNSDMARMFRISRTQLYKWMSSDSAVQLEAANWRRLADLAQVARDWSSMSASPLDRFINEPVDGRTTLLSMMAAAALDMGSIRAALRRFAAVPADRSSRHAKLRDSGIQPRPGIGTLTQDD